MTKRIITALLGASFALVLGASAASASTDISGPEDLARARAKAVTKAMKEAHARAGIQAQAEEENPECLGPDDPAVAQAIEDLRAAVEALLDKDKALGKLGDEFVAFNEKFGTALEESTTAAELNAAFNAYKAALLDWSARVKARFTELKPEFAALVEKHLTALAELKACEEVIQAETELYDGGQFFVDILSEDIDLLVHGDEEFPGLLKLARDAVDDAIKDLPPPPAERPDNTLPPEDNGPSLPDTGASALPMLLGGLALISGGSTVLVAVRRRRAA